MFEEVNEKLKLAKSKLRRKFKLDKKLQGVNDALSAREKQLKDLQKQLDKERKDVQDLAGITLSGVFHVIKGDKNEKLDKEKREYLAVKLKFDECREHIDKLNEEQRNILKELRETKEAEIVYDKLIDEKLAIVASKKLPEAERLLDNSEKISDLESDIKELSEAIEAGKFVLASLNEVEEHLKKAKDLGTWDLFTDSIFVGHAKHDSVRKSQVAIGRVQQNMQSFKRELNDVGQIMPENDISLNISDYEHFADWFFDNWISDWVVNSKVAVSLDRTIDAKSETKDMLRKLENLISDRRLVLDGLEAEQRSLVESIS